MFISEINMNTNTYFAITRSLIYVMKLVIIFGIKMCQKLSIFLTVSSQKEPKSPGSDEVVIFYSINTSQILSYQVWTERKLIIDKHITREYQNAQTTNNPDFSAKRYMAYIYRMF